MAKGLLDIPVLYLSRYIIRAKDDYYHPYTRTEWLQQDLSVSRLTATKYLERLTEGGSSRSTRQGVTTTP